MLGLGRVSKMTKGLPVETNKYEDKDCAQPGNIVFRLPEQCP